MEKFTWKSTIEPEAYLNNHSDSMLRVGSTSWKVGPMHAVGCKLTLPNRLELELDFINPDFARESYEPFQSTLLWVHSLGYVPQILAGVEDPGVVTDLLERYNSFLHYGTWISLSEKMDSLVHCVALRIRTMCMVAAQYATLNLVIPRVVLSILKEDLRWASIPQHYTQNNQGMMLASAIIHASLLFPVLVDESLESLAESNLESILINAFDSEWVCKENTVAYHAFYIRFFTNLLDFLCDTGSSSVLAQTLRPMIDSAQKILQIMVLPNGNFPAMGDSGISPSRVASIDGTVLSTESGIYIDKSNGVYRTFKCGFSSFAHKHMDDTSITLSIDDDELLLDAGLHSYDREDPYTLAVKSQRGHSGLFYQKFDGLYPGSLYHARFNRIQSSMHEIDTHSSDTILLGEYIIDEEYLARRMVSFSPGRISIQDSFSVDDDENTAIQRFLVPAGAEIGISEGELRMQTTKSWLQIHFDPSRTASIQNGLHGELPEAWISRKLGEIQACYTIEIEAAKNSNLMTAVVLYGRIADES